MKALYREVGGGKAMKHYYASITQLYVAYRNKALSKEAFFERLNGMYLVLDYQRLFAKSEATLAKIASYQKWINAIREQPDELVSYEAPRKPIKPC